MGLPRPLGIWIFAKSPMAFSHAELQRARRENPDKLTLAGGLVFLSPLQRGVGGVNEMKTIFPCRAAKKVEEGKLDQSLRICCYMFRKFPLIARLESPGRGGLGLFDQGLDPDDLAFRRVGVKRADHQAPRPGFGPKHGKPRQPGFFPLKFRPKAQRQTPPSRVGFQIIVELRILGSAHVFDGNDGFIAPSGREFDMSPLTAFGSAGQKAAGLGKMIPGGGQNLVQFQIALKPRNGVSRRSDPANDLFPATGKDLAGT